MLAFAAKLVADAGGGVAHLLGSFLVMASSSAVRRATWPCVSLSRTFIESSRCDALMAYLRSLFASASALLARSVRK